MRRFLAMALAAAVALLAAGALEAATDRIVAVVNGEIITLSQLDGRVAAMTKSGKLKGAAQDDVRRKVLDALVEQELVSQAAKARGIIITQADVSQAVEAVKQENHLTDAQLKASLAQSGATMDSFREDLAVELMRNRILGGQIAGKIVVTDKEVLALLNGEGPAVGAAGPLGNFSPNDHLPVRIIVIPIDKAHKDASFVEAQRVKAEIEEGLPFAEAAGLYSRGPGADNGGDTGDGLVVGQLQPALKAAVDKLEPGRPSEPVDVGNAYIILSIVPPEAAQAAGKGEKAAKLSDFPDEAVQGARRQLERYKMQQRYAEWLADLKRKAIVRINL